MHDRQFKAFTWTLFDSTRRAGYVGRHSINHHVIIHKTIYPNFLSFVDFGMLALGNEHSLMLKQDSSVWGVGSNGYNQLDVSFGGKPGFKPGKQKPRELRKDIYTEFKWIFKDAKAVAAGGQHSLVIQQDGSFHQHGPQLYTGWGYGGIFSTNVLVLESYARGTEWAMDDDSWDTFAHLVLDGQALSSRGANFDFLACGRLFTYFKKEVKVIL